jgi:hypothetical protein
VVLRNRHLTGIVSQLKSLNVVLIYAGAALILEGGDSHLVEVHHKQQGILDCFVTCHLPKL